MSLYLTPVSSVLIKSISSALPFPISAHSRDIWSPIFTFSFNLIIAEAWNFSSADGGSNISLHIRLDWNNWKLLTCYNLRIYFLWSYVLFFYALLFIFYFYASIQFWNLNIFSKFFVFIRAYTGHGKKREYYNVIPMKDLFSYFSLGF